jgi:CxxC motif-containing protein (DUF1111 family)
MNQDECDALVAFVRALPAPASRTPGDAREASTIEQGEKTFRSIGCAACHLPKLGNVDGIYSDLLLHDMSPELEDVGGYSVFIAAAPAAQGDGAPAAGPAGKESTEARPGEWRTPPLWGLRDSGPYLHDGRAENVTRAILLHGGEGAAAAERFARLTPRRKRQVEAFLMSLEAPAPGARPTPPRKAVGADAP